ncbi:hypothetical protein FA95DRAFT_922147 [Auriscalpium vulgare]|uniref:Uncharacterized protein n=1 Tax=Auriscalpium vulgare TaxID=40419 RepID=A0ACB8S059_9AGAM|nr:hypothetical protein FA95DRAFT_922147 [Auriscalpium vulgare]
MLRAPSPGRHYSDAPRQTQLARAAHSHRSDHRAEVANIGVCICYASVSSVCTSLCRGQYCALSPSAPPSPANKRAITPRLSFCISPLPRPNAESFPASPGLLRTPAIQIPDITPYPERAAILGCSPALWMPQTERPLARTRSPANVGACESRPVLAAGDGPEEFVGPPRSHCSVCFLRSLPPVPRIARNNRVFCFSGRLRFLIMVLRQLCHRWARDDTMEPPKHRQKRQARTLAVEKHTAFPGSGSASPRGE